MRSRIRPPGADYGPGDRDIQVACPSPRLVFLIPIRRAPDEAPAVAQLCDRVRSIFLVSWRIADSPFAEGMGLPGPPQRFCLLLASFAPARAPIDLPSLTSG